MNEFSVEKHGTNIVAIRTKDFVVKLEYDFTIKGFRELSPYEVTKTYFWKKKVYNRDLPLNRHRYYKLLSQIPTTVWDIAYTLFTTTNGDS